MRSETKRRSGPGPGRGRRGRTIPLPLALILALPATGLLTSCERKPISSFPKVVVLPHRDSSGGVPSQDISAGFATEIGHWLSYAPNLVVRTGSTPRREVDERFAEVAAAMDVDYVVWLEAGQSQDGWKVSYELAEVHGPSLFSETVTALKEELPALPRGIAEAVLGALPVATGDPSETMKKPMASDPESYLGLLRLSGRTGVGINPREDLLRRVEALEAIVSQLGGYPSAVTSLGSAYLDLAGLVGGTGPYYELAGETLSRGFELDPTYPPARDKLASYFAKRGRSEQALTLLQQGISSHPAFSGFHENLGYVLRYAGCMEESMGSYRRSQELDGSLEHLVSSQDQITKSLIYLGDYGGALASQRRMEEHLDRLGQSPNEKQYFYLGVIHLYSGDQQRAVEAFRRGSELDPESVWTMFGQAYEGMAIEDPDRVTKILDRLEQRVVVDGERHYRLVHFAAFLKQPERALDHLEAAVKGGFFNAPYIASDPLTASLRSLPQFQELLVEAEKRHDAFRELMIRPSPP